MEQQEYVSESVADIQQRQSLSHMFSQISISLALSQTLAYTLRPWLWG